MKPSVEVNRNDRSSKLVQRAFTVHGPEAADRLTRRLGSHLQEGQSVPDIRMLMQLFLQWLVSSTREMVTADIDNELEIANDKKFRVERAEVLERLTQKLIALRDACVAFYGKTQIEEIGFSEQTPRNSNMLYNVGKKLIELFRKPEFALPVPRFGNLTIDPAAMAEAIEPEVQKLDELIECVDVEVKKAQSTQAVKNDKVTIYKGDFFWIARWLEATFALAGMMHESRKVKPSSRQRGRTVIDPATDEPGQDEPGQDGEDQDKQGQAEA